MDNDFLAVTAARLTYERGSETLDLVYAPRFTPSRIPLVSQRWVVLPEGLPLNLEIRDLGAGTQGLDQEAVDEAVKGVESATLPVRVVAQDGRMERQRVVRRRAGLRRRKTRRHSVRHAR